MPVTPRGARPAIALLAAALHGIGVVFLAVCGVMLWRLYCEGFGCIGTGIAWFAWAIAFVVVLVLGLFARQACAGVVRSMVRHGLMLQVAAGAALLAYWAWRQAA